MLEDKKDVVTREGSVVTREGSVVNGAGSVVNGAGSVEVTGSVDVIWTGVVDVTGAGSVVNGSGSVVNGVVTGIFSVDVENLVGCTVIISSVIDVKSGIESLSIYLFP